MSMGNLSLLENKDQTPVLSSLVSYNRRPQQAIVIPEEEITVPGI